jgi:flagellar L-ring protein precursor FlgH
MMRKSLVLLAAAAALAGCATDPKEIGRPPSLSPVGSGIEQGAVSVYRYPETPATPVKKFSLWDDRQSRLFTDPRALRAGDILTVKIKINDRARTLGLAADVGWDAWKAGGSAKGNLDSKTETKADGAIERSESIELNVAAVVTDVLPNGNLMIRGSQEVRVNAELRVLTIAGMVRPSDIGAANTVSYERIAEARISYGGRGRVSEIQQPGYGQQILDQVLPF